MPIRKANNLPAIHRYITTHTSEGEAVFISHSHLPDLIPSHTAGEDGEISLLYTTLTNPVSVDEDLDIVSYDEYLHIPPGLTTQQGSVLRMIDLKPGKVTPMHRSVSFDYGVIVEGEVDLILDSGQSRILRRGDVFVQRGTAHSFRNRSERDWCRALLVFFPMKSIVIKGKELEAETYDEAYLQNQDDGNGAESTDKDESNDKSENQGNKGKSEDSDRSESQDKGKNKDKGKKMSILSKDKSKNQK